MLREVVEWEINNLKQIGVEYDNNFRGEETYRKKLFWKL